MTSVAWIVNFRSILRWYFDREYQELSIVFLRIVPSHYSFSSRTKKLEVYTFPQNLGKFLKFQFLWPWRYWPRVRKMHMIEVFSQPTFHKKLVILAFIGAELAGGRFCPPPLPVRIILDTIPGRGLTGRPWGLMEGSGRKDDHTLQDTVPVILLSGRPSW